MSHRLYFVHDENAQRDGMPTRTARGRCYSNCESKLLALIYRWFTEGFDTTDLKDARALLDAPSA
jgi:hypothetical protein